MELFCRRTHSDSLEAEVGSRVDGLADVVVDGEGKDLCSTPGPHRPAVQRVHRLTQTHERRVDAAHSQGFNGRAVLLLQQAQREGGSRVVQVCVHTFRKQTANSTEDLPEV